MLNLVKLLVGPITGLLEKVIPDKDAREKMAHEIATMTEVHAHEGMRLQMQVNDTQAKHSSVFVAGARPAIMWICGMGIAMNFVVRPVVVWIAFFAEFDVTGMPEMDMSELMTLLLGMLGLSVSRSYEKKNGVARNAIKP